MLNKLFLPLALIGLLALSHSAVAADPKSELQTLVGKIRTKVQSGVRTESGLDEELKGFDSLLAEHKGEKTEDVAEILLMKAILYAEVLKDEVRATELLKTLKTDFPDTDAGKRADNMIASIERQREAKKIQGELVEGSKFPDFEVQDIDGKPLSIGNYKGKIVMLDFWATWCGPCVHELPNVVSVYGKYHDKGFEIIGISLDQDKEKLTSFLKEKNVTWAQYFDGQGWQNKLASKYGITSIPSTFLLDKEGKIIGVGLRGEELQGAIEKAVAAR